MASWKFLPWIMEFLGVPLKCNPPPPEEPDSETDEEMQADPERLKAHYDKKKAKEKKKKKEEEAAAKAAQEAAAAKEERHRKRAELIDQGLDPVEQGIPESEEEIIIEDASIERISLQEDENGKLPRVDRFILIGFPQTAAHCEKLKEFNIDFDRILFLSEEENEEDAGKEVS